MLFSLTVPKLLFAHFTNMCPVFLFQLFNGFIEVGPLIFQEWQAWRAEKIRQRDTEMTREEERLRRQEEREREQYERDRADEKRRLEVENDIARAQELVSLRQEVQAQRSLLESNAALQKLASTGIPVLDFLSLPVELRAATLKKEMEDPKIVSAKEEKEQQIR
jgi:hypothetical protein